MRESIVSGIDEHDICKIFQEYFECIKKHIFTKCALTSNLSLEEKEGVYNCIYDYSMQIIYPQVFPPLPTKADNELLKRSNEYCLKEKDQSEINLDNYHPELWDYCIKRSVYFLKSQ